MRDLANPMAGRVFCGATVGWPKQLPLNTPKELRERLQGQSVRSVTRRGKYIVFELCRDYLLVHLKMSGRLQLVPATMPPNSHAHVVFQLVGGDELRFHNPRKFGRVFLLADPAPILSKLGPEPLDEKFTIELFGTLIAGRRGRVKPLLLNQTFVAGLGNIYTDESLWKARIHPLRTADTLSLSETEALHGAIRTVLARAVRLRGTTLTEGGYRDLTGNRGEMQGTLSVYGRTGEACPRCGAEVVRLVVGGRGTHVCLGCQPPPS